MSISKKISSEQKWNKHQDALHEARHWESWR
ncbi:hypothetical protein Krac_1252 [Ktedonobacter racemifer DSM 44963]|uniref:Uncharacterized protein n=1 Tax=Ktedonobacter racemifer DSM 44963 TaxID=485913 RepID=D6U6M6_KTERA|nr:hypothetical protein Krac_1252 [Ktedonobacter racemifer DSM 44963]